MSSSGASTAHFTLCAFNYNATKGLCIRGALSGVTKIYATNCTAIGNGEDGFAINSDSSGAYSYLYLINCTSTGHTTNSSSDGVTAHLAGQNIFIYGGNFSNNSNGVSIVGDNTGTAAGPMVHIAGGVVFAGNIYGLKWNSNNTFVADVDNITIEDIASGGYGIYCAGHGSFSIDNVRLKGNVNSNNAVLFSGSAQNTIGILTRCIIYNFTKKDIRAVDTGNIQKGIIIKNCIFYNNDRHIITRGPGTICNNTIFMNALDSGQGAWVKGDNSACYNNHINGRNVFYNNAKNFYDATDVLETSEGLEDLAVNPQFVDAENGDFRLMPSSPCLNKGMLTVLSGYTSIGAWQRKSMLGNK
jgi:hypothetical protein